MPTQVFAKRWSASHRILGRVPLASIVGTFCACSALWPCRVYQHRLPFSLVHTDVLHEGPDRGDEQLDRLEYLSFAPSGTVFPMNTRKSSLRGTSAV